MSRLDVSALGMIETIGLVSAIEAADAGLKAADVRLLGTDYVRGGLVMVRFEGEVAAVKAAVEAGKAAASHVGKVFSAHVIARAMPEVFCMLAADGGKGPARRAQDGCAQCGGCEGGRRDANRAGGKRGAGNQSDASEHGDDPKERGGTLEHGDDPKERGGTPEHGDDPKERGGTPERGGNRADHQDARSIDVPFSSSEQEPSALDTPRSAENGRRALLPAQEILAGWKVVALRSFVRTLPGFHLSPAEIRYATKRALMDALAAYRAGEV